VYSPFISKYLEEDDTPSKKRVTWREELEETRDLDEILQIGKKREKWSVEGLQRN